MNTQATMSSKNLLDTAAANASFSIFSKAVQQAGLTDTLRGTGPFTVFAPTDAAFSKLPKDKLDNLMKPENKNELASVLKYHVVKGRKSAEDIAKWNSAPTIHGQAAPILNKDGHLVIDGAQVTNSDIGTTNGVIHAIDKVNIPSQMNS
jgi:uncharacterized surface protein with fasciclin (FAS1) repeats